MSKLLGKRALVTAGAQGIGFAISSHLLRAGCDVFVHYRSSADGARDLAAEAAILGRRFASASADLTTSEASNALVTQAVTFSAASTCSSIMPAPSSVAAPSWRPMTDSGPT